MHPQQLDLRVGARHGARAVGRCKLELCCEPWLVKATGFKPVPLNINPGFKTCLFKSNLRRYSAAPGGERGGRRDVAQPMVALYKLNVV
jgi:hypothetical protein